MPSLPGLFGSSRLVLITAGAPVNAALELEASLSETHRRAATITEHPTEVGADFVDHISFRPREVDITGIISNTPVMLLPTISAVGVAGGDPRGRAEDAFLLLEGIMEQGALCSIATTLFTYENMVLTSLSTPRDAARGGIAELQMTFREILLAETDRVGAPVPKDPTFGVRVKLGKQAATAAKAAESAKAASVVAKVLGFLGI